MQGLFPVTERWSAYSYNNFDLNAELTKNVWLHAAWNLDVLSCSGLTDQAVIINSNLTAEHKEQAHAQRNILERRRKIRKWKLNCLITWLLPLHKYFPLYFDVWCTKHFPGVFITRQSWKLFLRSQPLTADRRCISTGGADKKILKDWMRKYFNRLNERLNQLNSWRKTQAMSIVKEPGTSGKRTWLDISEVSLQWQCITIIRNVSITHVLTMSRPRRWTELCPPRLGRRDEGCKETGWVLGCWALTDSDSVTNKDSISLHNFQIFSSQQIFSSEQETEYFNETWQPRLRCHLDPRFFAHETSTTPRIWAFSPTESRPNIHCF